MAAWIDRVEPDLQGFHTARSIIDEMMVTAHGKSVGQESDGDESN